MTKKICIIDDHEIVRSGIKKIINTTTQHKVHYEFNSNHELAKQNSLKKVDLIIQDLDFEEGCDLSQLESLKTKFPSTPILIYTMHSESIYGLACLKYNISGYLTKDKPIDKLIDAVNNILNGKRYFTQEFNNLLTDFYSNKKSFSLTKLSQREYEVFILIGEGLTLTKIAEKLFINTRTVSVYRKRILNKLNMNSTNQLIHFYLFNKLNKKSPF